MNTKLYEMWVTNHQIQPDDFDVTESVMKQIHQEKAQSRIFQRAWEVFLLDLIQARVWMRAGVLTAGALAGLLRVAFVVYCGLFA